jgi:hypothetical protein
MFGTTSHPAIRRIGTLVAAAAMATTLFTAQAAAPAETRAASLTGPNTPAFVTCNWRYNTLTLTPNAGAAPGLAQQTISYRYWVLDRTLNKYVAGWNPSGYGTILHNYQYYVGEALITIPGPIQGAADALTLVDGHAYSVYVEYWWPTTTGWVNAGAWTTSYGTAGYAWDVKGAVNNWCVL